MTLRSDLADAQTRNETTRGASFEADYGAHTCERVWTITTAHGSKACGVTDGWYWTACAKGRGLVFTVRRDTAAHRVVVPVEGAPVSADIQDTVRNLVACVTARG